MLKYFLVFALWLSSVAGSLEAEVRTRNQYACEKMFFCIDLYNNENIPIYCRLLTSQGHDLPFVLRGYKVAIFMLPANLNYWYECSYEYYPPSPLYGPEKYEYSA